MSGKREGQIRRMEYPVLPAEPSPETEVAVDPVERVRALAAELAAREKQFVQTLERTRQEAFEQGKRLVQGEQTAWRQESSAALRAALESFRAHSEEYFARVEQEVVRLALAVAERILRREAQLDPLLLSGPVRVALGQLAESTEVRLRVPAGQEALWAEMVRLVPGLPVRPEVRADPGLAIGEAVLETHLGTVDLGVEAQLEQIGNSLLDAAELPGGISEDGAASAEKRG